MMIQVLSLFWHGDSAAAYQMGFQDPATTSMEGIYLFNLHLLFVIIAIVLLVGWLIFIILQNFTELNKSIVQNFTYLNLLRSVWRFILAFIVTNSRFLPFSLFSSFDGKSHQQTASILATSTDLPSKVGKLQVVLVLIYDMSCFLVPYLILADFILVAVSLIIFFFRFLRNSKLNDALFTEMQDLFHRLPLLNKFFLASFTLSVAIPNKIWVNNSIGPFSTFVLAFMLLLLGGLFPFFICIYFVLFVLVLESLFFGLSYEYSPTFRQVVNRLFFNSTTNQDALVIKKYFDFFFGNMFRMASSKLGPFIAAVCGGTGAGASFLMSQRLQESAMQDEHAHKTVMRQIEVDKLQNTVGSHEYYEEVYAKSCENWTQKQGFVLKAESHFSGNKNATSESLSKGDMPSATSSSPTFDDIF